MMRVKWSFDEGQTYHYGESHGSFKHGDRQWTVVIPDSRVFATKSGAEKEVEMPSIRLPSTIVEADDE